MPSIVPYTKGRRIPIDRLLIKANGEKFLVDLRTITQKDFLNFVDRHGLGFKMMDNSCLVKSVGFWRGDLNAIGRAIGFDGITVIPVLQIGEIWRVIFSSSNLDKVSLLTSYIYDDQLEFIDQEEANRYQALLDKGTWPFTEPAQFSLRIVRKPDWVSAMLASMYQSSYISKLEKIV